MKTLLKTLTANNKEIKKDRANQIVAVLEMGQTVLVQGLSLEVMNLKNKITNHKDLAPSSTTSLKFEGVDDGQAWINQLQELKMKLKVKEVELKAAIETQIELFDDEDQKKG